MFTFGKTCFGTSWSFCLVSCPAVTRRNYWTSFGVILIIFTYASFDTIECASCRSCCCPTAIVVAKCWNNCLRYKVLVTYQAVGTFGKTSCFASWSNRYFDTCGVVLCRDNCLCYDYFATNGAMFTFGKTCFGTSWGFSSINYFGVTKRWNHFLSGWSFVTSTAMFTLGKTCFGTGWSNSDIYYIVVTKRGDCYQVFLHLAVANCAVNNFVVLAGT